MSDLKILLFEDSPMMYRIFLNILQKAGYTDVKYSNCGKDALAQLMAGDFDLLLTDWNISNMNGIELVKAVRADNLLKKLPILIVTARNKREDIINAAKAGVNGFIIKPVEFRILKEKIAEITK